jgi:asparagine synthase (glutamine-hydrolysing)
MRDCGARILMTGSGGDHLFWSTPDGAVIIADQLQQGHFRAAHRECLAWSHFMNMPYVQLLLKQAVPLTIGIGRAAQYQAPLIPAWIHRTWRDRLLSDKHDVELAPRRSTLPSFRAHLRVIHSLFNLLSAGYHNEYHDLYFTHPYTHRPLVEFCLATPISQFLRAGQTRSLMRRALRDLLPAKVCCRRSKASPQESFIRALQQEWHDVLDLDRWQLCQRGFINPPQVTEHLNKFRLGLQLPGGGLLDRLFSAERWLRSLSLIRGSSNYGAPAVEDSSNRNLNTFFGKPHQVAARDS